MGRGRLRGPIQRFGKVDLPRQSSRVLLPALTFGSYWIELVQTAPGNVRQVQIITFDNQTVAQTFGHKDLRMAAM
jgi:hypothetical protein